MSVSLSVVRSAISPAVDHPGSGLPTDPVSDLISSLVSGPMSDLDAAYRAIFHGRPARGLQILGSWHPTAPPAAWLAGVALGAVGRYDEARDALRPVLKHPPDRVDRYRSLAASTYASLERQQGRYDSAAEFDRVAAATAGGSLDAQLDALVGLTADAVGHGDLATARANLATLDAVLASAPPPPVPSQPGLPPPRDNWRAPIRRGWVACEVALLAEDPPAAVAAVLPAVTLAARRAAPRHLAKSLLFLGVAVRETVERRMMITKEIGRKDTGWPADLGRTANGLIRRAESEAMSIGATPLVTVARSLAVPTVGPVGTAAATERGVACATAGRTPS